MTYQRKRNHDAAHALHTAFPSLAHTNTQHGPHPRPSHRRSFTAPPTPMDTSVASKLLSATERVLQHLDQQEKTRLSALDGSRGAHASALPLPYVCGDSWDLSRQHALALSATVGMRAQDCRGGGGERGLERGNHTQAAGRLGILRSSEANRIEEAWASGLLVGRTALPIGVRVCMCRSRAYSLCACMHMSTEQLCVMRTEHLCVMCTEHQHVRTIHVCVVCK